jgi:hypothetical protein
MLKRKMDLSKLMQSCRKFCIKRKLRQNKGLGIGIFLEGDRNTTYFHAVANHRRRKTLIHALEGPAGEVTNISDMLDVATIFGEVQKWLLSKPGFIC